MRFLPAIADFDLLAHLLCENARKPHAAVVLAEPLAEELDDLIGEG